MTTDLILWSRVHASFPYSAESVQAEINRIAIKCLKKARCETDIIVFDSGTCDVSAEVVKGSDLGRLVRAHNRTRVTGRTTPIVIVRVDSKDVVVDGNNRVNKWVEDGDLTPRQALMIVSRERPRTS